jgi:hypothetical protein
VHYTTQNNHHSDENKMFEQIKKTKLLSVVVTAFKNLIWKASTPVGYIIGVGLAAFFVCKLLGIR